MKIGNKRVLIGILILTGLMQGCTQKKEEAEEVKETVVSVEISKPQRKDISLSYNFSGTVQAQDTIVVIPKVAGEVVEKHFEVGDHVNEGDLLFRIDDSAAQISLKQAQAALTSAQAGYTSQQATQASAYASATETLGKIPTNDQQLGVAVDSAYATKVQANAQRDTANASSDYYNSSYDKAKQAVDDAVKARDNALATLNTAKQSGDIATISSATIAYQTAEANVKTAESARDQAELAKKTNENNAKSAEMQYYVAEENYGMAVQNKQDYETYTVNSTMYGANAQMVGADAALTNSKASVDQARANVENAQLALDYTQVKSPVSGIITAINVSEHNMASQQTQAYIIQSDAKEKIVFYVAEETQKNMQVGNPAIVTKNGTDYPAVITTIENTIDQSTGLFKIEAALSANFGELVSGSVVNIRTVTRQSKGVITVPINSVYYDGDQAYVYVAENDVAVRKNLTVGLSDDEVIEVLEGITENDRVIITYSAQLNDGVSITELVQGENK